MIERLLNKFGYIKIKDLEEADISENEAALSQLLANILSAYDSYPDADAEKKLMLELKNVEGFVDYLRETANADIRRYFGAGTDKERDAVRGAFARTNYLKAKIIDADKEKDAKLESPRYG